jgi:hypothetical protein
MKALQLVMAATVGILTLFSASADANPSGKSPLGITDSKAAIMLELASNTNPVGRCRANFKRSVSIGAVNRRAHGS